MVVRTKTLTGARACIGNVKKITPRHYLNILSERSIFSIIVKPFACRIGNFFSRPLYLTILTHLANNIYMYVLYVCCSAKSMYILIIDFGGLKEKHAPVIKYENVYVHRGNYFISTRCFYVIRTSRDVKLRRQIFLRRTFKLIVSQPIRDFGGCLAKCYVIIV